MLDAADINGHDGSLLALSTIVEDCADKMDDEIEIIEKGLDEIIPKIVNFMLHQEPLLQEQSLKCMNSFILPMPNPMMKNTDHFLNVSPYI